MSRSSFLLSGGLIAALLLGACMPATAQPTGPSAEEIRSQISTSVALTIAAYTAEQAVLASATAPPTETPIATPTATLAFPTLTPFPTSTPGASGGGGGAPTIAPYVCGVVNKTPIDNTVFKPNKDFDVRFWIMNVGSKKWDKGADLLYDSGTNMLTTAVTYELPEVLPGAMVGPFVFDAKSPKKAGTFTMVLKVQGGFCYPYITIIVKK